MRDKRTPNDVCGEANDLLNDFSSQITSLQKIVSQQSSIIKKLQDENQILHEKHVQIDKANQALQESQNNLMTEIHFLKEQMTVLWQNSREPDPPSPSSQTESSCSENTTDSDQKIRTVRHLDYPSQLKSLRFRCSRIVTHLTAYPTHSKKLSRRQTQKI